MKPNQSARPCSEQEGSPTAVPARFSADAPEWEPFLDPRFASPELQQLFQKKVFQKHTSPALRRRILLELSDILIRP